ncbi:glycoside hydrolase family 97 protein [Echinicola sp. 20G]|uniref:glycoside hydrolase family 97 protein n=1 Tax=Echinicola sp. 20G TaxID=2781961 RepID=UPI00191068A4|nr:glycoside hydrolase family 97 protein [Echinicola sp. 20G]
MKRKVMMKKIDLTVASRIVLLAFMVIFVGCSNSRVNEWKVTSPDGSLKGIIALDESGVLTYQVKKQEGEQQHIVMEPSQLGIIRKDQRFDTLYYDGTQEVKIIDENYKLRSGKRLSNQNHYHELTLSFKNHSGNPIDIIFRAYDDGFAFKYFFPSDGSDALYTVSEELTSFDLPTGKAWMQPYDSATAYAPAYERNYEGDMTIGTSAPGKEGWCFPALFQVNGQWVLLSESNLKANFHGSHLKPYAPKGKYQVTGPESDEAFGYGEPLATSKLPWDMPWRVMVVGSELGTIVESNLINHLADPSKIENTAWVEPGRASWAWWSGYLDGSNDTPEKLKHFIDFAQDMGWEYSLIDAGWDYRPGFDLTEMVEYANNRGVDLLMWYNSGGPINRVNAGPRDMMFDPEIRKQEMKRISDMGIKGIKVDFFSSDKQDFIQLFTAILEDAAKYKLLVNFHGCTIPRGWARTYPNMISYESVKGSEAYIYHADFERNSPMHNTILPFTRNVIGSMDYTPVAFSTQQVPHRTSFGHELALSVVFESGITHFADTPEMYLAQPEEVIGFLSEVPAAWEDTKFVSGYPAKEVVIARRKGEEWFVGGINGENTYKQLQIPMDFLGTGKYKATLIADGKGNKEFSIDQMMVSSQSLVDISMLAIGGFVMKITPEP